LAEQLGAPGSKMFHPSSDQYIAYLNLSMPPTIARRLKVEEKTEFSDVSPQAFIDTDKRNYLDALESP
jgi:hypothetical protein